MEEEVVLAFPAPHRELVEPATHVRGTWLLSSLRTLREHGHFDAYRRALPARWHRMVLETVTSDWHPIDVALAHYQACDELDVPPAEIEQIGAEALTHAQGNPLGVAARVAAGPVVTPWTILGQCQRFWDRMWRGGGVGVFKLGPKDARVEITSFPCARFRYCRIGICGVVRAASEIFCAKAYASEMPERCTPTDLVLRVSWA
jgi:hypothetical protein